MSASRDPSEKITFLFTPMSKLVQKVRESEIPAAPQKANPGRARVLKSEELRQASPRPGLVREYRAPQIQPTAPKPSEPAPLSAGLAREILTADLRLQAHRSELQNLEKSLQELEEIEKRLKFMMLELEELLKD